MKFAFLTLVLVAAFSTGCSKNDSNGNGGFNNPAPNNPQGGQEGAPVAGGKGFTAHPWCYAYNSDQGVVQDRFTFANGGALTYAMYDFQNGNRGAVIDQAQGKWGLSGSVLTLTVNGQTLTFQTKYVDPDPVTRGERLHVFMNGQDAPYDPCN